MEKNTIVLGVIGADCHAVGNRILENFFGNEGFNVINLGVMVSQDEFIDAAVETGAQAILVSSLYGHGKIDCIGFKEKCVERGLEDVVLYIGGNLVIGKTSLEEVNEEFTAMGFDRVFPPGIDLSGVPDLLRGDINRKNGTN